jgi:hypothetical protein
MWNLPGWVHLIQMIGFAAVASALERAVTFPHHSERLTAMGVMLRGPGTARTPEAV